MSLSKLPNELIAQIGSFLDYKENQKFALVNKRIHAVLARDRLDKPEIDKLSFVCYRENDEEYVKNKAYLQGEWIELEKLKDHKIHGSYIPKILNIINKFRSIGTLSLQDICFHDLAGFDLIRTKMRRLFVRDCGLWITRDTFVNFCKRFESIEFMGIFTDASFVNDAFFSELIRNGTTVQFKVGYKVGSRAKLVVNVTDSTLDALTATKIPKELSLESLVTKFSFSTVLKKCENVLKSDTKYVFYHFGFLNKDQYPAVMKFVNKDFGDWTARMKLPLTIDKYDFPYRREDTSKYTRIKISNRNDQKRLILIRFGVDMPDEFLKQENEMDTDEENSDEDQELQNKAAPAGGASTMTAVSAVPGGRSTMTAVGAAPVGGASTMTAVGVAPVGGASTMIAVGAAPGGHSTMTAVGGVAPGQGGASLGLAPIQNGAAPAAATGPSAGGAGTSAYFGVGGGAGGAGAQSAYFGVGGGQAAGVPRATGNQANGIPGQSAYFGVSGGSTAGASSAYFAPK